ncbi:MAG TPA: flippase [Candidatus Sulfotelmatobacter sp.]|jgi:O-antigen/teichoic acid export membrane protein
MSEDWQSEIEEAATLEGSRAVVGTASHDTSLAEAAKPTFKTEMGRISRQSGIAFAGTIFTALLGYGFKVYLARVLGAEALGLYALGVTIISFLGMVNVLGLPESAVRFVAVYSASKRFQELRELLWNGSWILLATNLAFTVVLLFGGPWVATRFYHSPRLARYLPLFAPIMFTSALNHYFGNVLAGYREVGRRTLVTKFIASPITIAVSVLLISLGAGLGGYLVGQIVSALCVMVFLISMVWRVTPVEARSPNWREPWIRREVWSFSAAMFGLGLAAFFIGQIDRVALGVYRGAQEVGVYSVAAGLLVYEVIILQSVNQIFAPVIADVHSRGEHALLGRLFQTLTKWILALTFPLAMVVIAFARPIMRMFGHDFEAGWPILVIGTIGQLVNCGVGSVGYMLLMSGNQRRLVRVQLVMAVVMVVLSFRLVPLWGALGAALAAAITNIVQNVWNLIEVRKALHLSPYNRSYLRLVPSVGAALAVTLLVSRGEALLRSGFLAVLVALLLAYAVFGLVALLIGLDADDRLVTDAIWARVKPMLGR